MHSNARASILQLCASVQLSVSQHTLLFSQGNGSVSFSEDVPQGTVEDSAFLC